LRTVSTDVDENEVSETGNEEGDKDSEVILDEAGSEEVALVDVSSEEEVDCEVVVEAASVDEDCFSVLVAEVVATVLAELTNEVNDEVAITSSLEDEDDDDDSTEVTLEAVSVESWLEVIEEETKADDELVVIEVVVELLKISEAAADGASCCCWRLTFWAWWSLSCFSVPMRKTSMGESQPWSLEHSIMKERAFSTWLLTETLAEMMLSGLLLIMGAAWTAVRTRQRPSSAKTEL
jgi:hypothetical protein